MTTTDMRKLVEELRAKRATWDALEIGTYERAQAANVYHAFVANNIIALADAYEQERTACDLLRTEVHQNIEVMNAARKQLEQERELREWSEAQYSTLHAQLTQERAHSEGLCEALRGAKQYIQSFCDRLPADVFDETLQVVIAEHEELRKPWATTPNVTDKT